MSGKVYLVGSGPGDISYLTLRGKQLLSKAQVLIYDDLVACALLQLVSDDCLQIYVGKRGGAKSTPQSTINQMLINYCLQGKQVVRLKSGDPLVFGRANAEIRALTDSGCDFELIPGISSALAAPLLAGIPLTDKDISRCFAVLSAHQPALLEWEVLARIDTLVILMGGSTLPEIVTQLTNHGRAPDTPIAIIRHCARPEQEVFWGTLDDILEKVAGISLSPAVMVIGEVVNHPIMSHSSSTPLAGKTVIVTRAAEQSSKFTQILQETGARVLEMPALEIVPPSSWQELDQAIAQLNNFDWLILTSANGVEYFFGRLKTLGKDARALGGVKIAVVGKKTAQSLQNYGLQADYIPPNFVADSLVENFPESLDGKKILFPRVETGGREVLVKEFESQGAQVCEVAAYESRCPSEINHQVWSVLQQKQADIITFASSKTVTNFYSLLAKKLPDKEAILSLLDGVSLASIGPQTSKTCYELFARVDVEAQEYTLEGLTKALVSCQ